jgi:hypothetical protein
MGSRGRNRASGVQLTFVQHDFFGSSITINIDLDRDREYVVINTVVLVSVDMVHLDIWESFYKGNSCSCS